MISTMYAKRSQYKPIDLFFRGIVDAKSKDKKVVFVDVFQVLNDRYVGRMSVSNYFAVAEKSVRMNELNLIVFEELRNYHIAMREIYYIPDKVTYSVPVTTRFLQSDEDFNIFLSALKDNGYKRKDIVLTFFASSMATLDANAKKRYARLRKSGYKICVSAFGDEYNSLDLLADITFDYLRCEARYFDTSIKKKRLLAMLLKFCSANKMTLIMDGVDAPAQYARFKREGVKLITGKSVSKMSRWVTNEFLGLPKLTDEQIAAYDKKLGKQLNTLASKDMKRLDEEYKSAIEKARSQEGDIMPSSPRPELAKSPYQIRLEQQRAEAMKAAKKLMLNSENSQCGKEYEVNDSNDSNDLDDSDADNANGVEVENIDNINNTAEEHANTEQGASAPERPEMPKNNTKNAKPIRPDFDKEEKLFNEFKHDNLFGSLSNDLGGGGESFGITLRVSKDEDDGLELIGKYNEHGQWVDEDGNVYNGYFNVDGEWVEYEKFNRNLEGHYNEYAQWVDNDGNIYDGYFDDEDRWVDYTYADSNGEIVDNGYFDDTLGKWVPFGYFDEEGKYHRF